VKEILKDYPLYTEIDTDDPAETLYHITCELTKGDPGRQYMANGDPGWPAEPPMCEIIEVKRVRDGKLFEAGDWTKIGLDENEEKNIERMAFQQAADNEAGAEEDWADAERERRLESDEKEAKP
jgi:hypothetical protein